MFAAICVALAALGHVVMSGTRIPWWALPGALAMASVLGWGLSAFERAPRTVLTSCVGLQVLLHVTLSLAQAGAHPRSGSPLTRLWISYLLCTAPAAPGSRHLGHTAAMPSLPSMDGGMGTAVHSMPGMGVPGHGMSTVSSAGMLAAHLCAAVVCGAWLGRGEQVAFDALRAVECWLSAPLRLPRLRTVPVSGVLLPLLRPASDRAPRRLLLARSITSRGPPARFAVA
ncbi:hypothetical protein OKJ48_36785 [Streptomyces kunmingensis]|uniref:MFS transporter n=1 Tax=Streptomyces kunmingensis TaxID=68225 RepID=A0ABU6CLY0_9ACTN|nr:hypothetical protein [Streptomyces kunmingensis]MEB3965739.1 hypothetical protein [Streptomyces kunmingensis]